MFETKENKDKKVTVRFTSGELEVMEKYMAENNIKSLTELIRAAVGTYIKE